MKLLEQVLSVWIGVCLFVLMCVVFLDVVMRNLFNKPFIWGTDMIELSMGMMAFGALPLLSLKLGHINVELLPVAEVSALWHLINTLVSALTAGVFMLVAWQFQVFAQRTGGTGEIMAQLELRWTYIWSALLALALLTVAVSIYVAIREGIRAIRAMSVVS